VSARYTGTALWNAHTKHDRSSAAVSRAIHRDVPEGTEVEIVLDIETAFGPYAVTLRGTYGGEQRYADLTGTWTTGKRNGSCSARLFDTGDGDLFLFGEWREADELYDWWVDLFSSEEAL
jgi:hypothetical protein